MRALTDGLRLSCTRRSHLAPDNVKANLPWHRRSHTTAVLLGSALLLLLARYFVDIKVSVSWRTHEQLWRAGPVQAVHHCSNTCFKARDGICDEGRELGGQQQQQPPALLSKGAHVKAVDCDLGTDCDDCGAWSGPQAHSSWAEPQLPIEFLRSHNISVRSRLVDARSAPPLAGTTFAYVDPDLDVDVSRQVETTGVVEIGISQVFYTALHQQCKPDQSAGLVVDVGANFGWFTLLAARLGCRVMAWEPVPHFRALLSYNLAANKLTDLVTVKEGVVADPPGSTQVVYVPNRGIWGTAGIDGANIDTGIANDGEYLKVEVIADSLDQELQGQHVNLMKVDVEGYEPAVMNTAKKLLSQGSLDNIVMEYTPGVLERAARWSEMWRPPQMLMDLTDVGFDLFWLPDDFTRVWTESRSMAAPLPMLRQVTPQNLLYDIWDAHAYRFGVLDQAEPHFCQTMVEFGLSNMGIPERLHPKSFHASFAHNTNIWATRDKQLQMAQARLASPTVGLIPLDVPTNASWFPPPGVSLGLGAVDCNDMAAEMQQRLQQQQPVHGPEVKGMMAVLIGRRCRCTLQLPCQQQQEAVERCTQAGQTPYRDLPDAITTTVLL